jgi:Holliday junction resolvase RusA-like endonuclease
VVSTVSPLARRWIATVEAAARVAVKEHGQQSGPLSVLMSFHFATPKKDRHGQPHTFVPDADNLAKLVLDSLMRAGLFKDDSAVSCLLARKTWAPSPSAGVAITIGPDRRVSLPQPTGPAWLAD